MSETKKEFNMLGRKITPKATYGMSTEKDYIVPAEGPKLKIKQAPRVILIKKPKITASSVVEVSINQEDNKKGS